MFSRALMQCLQGRQMALEEAARASGLPANRLRDLVEGLGPAPSQAEASALARALGPVYGPALVRAFVWDCCPEEYRELVVNCITVKQLRWRRWGRWLALAGALILLALAAQFFRYQIVPGQVPMILDRWTGNTRFSQHQPHYQNVWTPQGAPSVG